MEFLDLCGGDGTFIMYLAKKFPQSHFWNLDINKPAYNRGTKLAAKLALHNTFFELRDAYDLPEEWREKFSFASVICSLHDLPFPVKAVEKLHRVMKPGGYLSVLEYALDDDPRMNAKIWTSSIFYCISLFHCLGVSMAFEGSAGLGSVHGHQTLTKILEQGRRCLALLLTEHQPLTYCVKSKANKRTMAHLLFQT